MKTFRTLFIVTLNACTFFLPTDIAIQLKELDRYLAFDFRFKYIGKINLLKPVYALYVSPFILLYLF